MKEIIPKIFFCEINDIEIKPDILCELPQERQRRINNAIKRNKAKQLYASALLTEFVFNKFGINTSNIKISENGKPYVDSDFYFNISHSGKYAVLAVGKNDVGIDIQEKNAVSENAAKMFFKDTEQIKTNANTEYYYSYIWCRKEAFLKCLGTGWNTENEHRISVLKNNIECNGSKYYLTDYNIFESCFLCLCEKNIHNKFVIEEVSKRELELFFGSNQ